MPKIPKLKLEKISSYVNIYYKGKRLGFASKEGVFFDSKKTKIRTITRDWDEKDPEDIAIKPKENIYNVDFVGNTDKKWTYPALTAKEAYRNLRHLLRRDEKMGLRVTRVKELLKKETD